MLKIHLGREREDLDVDFWWEDFGFGYGGSWADVGIELSSRETSQRQSLWPVGEG